VLARFKQFNTKFLLVTGVSVLLGSILNMLVARQGIHKLSSEATHKIEAGLNSANREYLTNHLGDTVQHVNSSFTHAISDLQILADIAQVMVDREEDLGGLHQTVAALPYFKDTLAYKPPGTFKNGKGAEYKGGGWLQSASEEPTVVTSWGYLQKDGAALPEVKREIDRSAYLDLILPSLSRRGADKVLVYMVGPPDKPFTRAAPFVDMGSAFDELYPGHNENNFYEFFYRGLVPSWEGWIKEPGGIAARKDYVTIFPPYNDAGGGGLVMTIFHPLWTKDRQGIAAAFGLDLTLTQIIKYIQDVKLAETGFAFLAQANGNVVAVNESGATRLGLQAKADKQGLELLQRLLKDSKEPQVAAIELPKDAGVQYLDEVQIGGEPHIMVLQQLATFQTLNDGKLAPENWTLGFVVPKKEIYASLYAAQRAIEESRTSIVTSQAFIAIGSILVLMAGVFLISRRMTGALVALSEGASRMRLGDYGVRVGVSSDDEIGQLSVAFNDMAAEIQAHTQNLEELVKARTKELEEANKEIMSLNAQLAQENLRLGAELNVARQLQLMVLPPAQELKEIKDLDIAGYMSPADEVGGDYYDVLRGNGVVKIGIGDVTGHGLESGVLMLMVQTAVRTLLASNETDPQRFLSIVNKVIYQNIQRISSDKNLTLSLMDYSDGMIRLTGQHEEVIIVRTDGTLERVDTTGLGLPVGMDEDISDFLSDIEIKLAVGDVVILFTDGVTEAERTDTKQYGVERLCEVVLRNHDKPSQEIKDAVIDDVMAHIGNNKIYDDITVLVIKRL
jgi:sigma-B regulation protein RsbU (phosphoserine phosphatase)